MSAQGVELESPALLARLRRAREDRSLSQGSVADRLGIARTTLVAIEQGERRLRPQELVGLAEIYGIRLETLLRSEPSPRPLAAQFRTAISRLPDESELREAAAELQTLAEDYVELEILAGAPLAARYPPATEIRQGSDLDKEAAHVAEAERGRLRIGDGPLPHLREVLENDVGLRVFSLALPSNISGLFGFDGQLGACVAINSGHRWERQRWSLAHEYAHFLTRRERAEATIVLAGYKRVPASERFADAFARHLLLPSAGVARRYETATAEAGRATAALLLQQADWWGVSFQAYVLRLEGLRLVKPGLYDHFEQRGFKVDEGRELLGLPPRPADASMLPRRFRLLAVSAYVQGNLSEERLAHLLREGRVAARENVAQLGVLVGGDAAGE
jgi:Zn-dependent peptidase ImmA (M78 family)/transcriptional regulator with XRE-family HTH domain